MSQGQFTKEEAQATRKAFEEIYTTLSRNKKLDFLGHANDIYLFIDAAEHAAPLEVEAKK